MIICHSNRYIFVHIHKTGGSSIEVALEPTLQWQDILLGSTPFGEQANRHYSQRFGITKHSSISDIYRLQASERLRKYKVLAVVRDPLDRAVSLYNFISGVIGNLSSVAERSLDELREHHQSLSCQYRQLSWPSSIAFLESRGDFAAFVRNPHLQAARGFQSQHSQLSIDNELVRHLTVLRTEELNHTTTAALLSALCGSSVRIPYINKSRYAIIKAESVCPETRTFLESRFRIDYASFGYG